METWTQLTEVAAELEVAYLDIDSQWVGSPFEWIKTRPSRQVGAIGEKIVARLFEMGGHEVERSPDSEADRVIDGRRIEIKFSTLWKNGGYKFQQVRDQDYEAAVCLGVSPQDAHLWFFPKRILYDHVIGHTGQHGGRGGQDTAWIHLNPDAPLSWAIPWGGQLEAGMEVAKAELRT